jgi:hypothetical protein
MQETDNTPVYGMQGPKERRVISTRKEKLSTYRTTIHQFLPFVLVRCSKYTNCKSLAETIATYSFICAYRLSEILDGANKIIILIDNMVGVIGEEFGQRRGIGDKGKLLFKWDDDLLFAKQLSETGTEECLTEIKKTSRFYSSKYRP